MALPIPESVLGYRIAILLSSGPKTATQIKRAEGIPDKRGTEILRFLFEQGEVDKYKDGKSTYYCTPEDFRKRTPEATSEVWDYLCALAQHRVCTYLYPNKLAAHALRSLQSLGGVQPIEDVTYDPSINVARTTIELSVFEDLSLVKVGKGCVYFTETDRVWEALLTSSMQDDFMRQLVIKRMRYNREHNPGNYSAAPENPYGKTVNELVEEVMT